MWEVEEAGKGVLKTSLNAIARKGDVKFILEATRKDFVIIIWERDTGEK